jgi:transposase-like protein
VYERYRSVFKYPTNPNKEPVLRNITANHGRGVREWREAMNQFAILQEERFTEPANAAR